MLCSRQYYSKRLVLVNEIKKIATDIGITLEEAVSIVENERIDAFQGCSLDKIYKCINIRNKQQ